MSRAYLGDKYIIEVVELDRDSQEVTFAIVKEYREPLPPRPWYTRAKRWIQGKLWRR
jgi:hypothetical protein